MLLGGIYSGLETWAVGKQSHVKRGDSKKSLGNFLGLGISSRPISENKNL